MDKKLKAYFSELGKRSAKKRFKKLSKKQISERMKEVRKGRQKQP